jgi:rSAM/selenodomain-associated transferase 1
MSGALAVFVKTPGLSPVKTRLAATLGQESAEAFHLAASRSVAAVADALSQQVDLQSYYAVAESDGLEHSYWQDLPCLWQGEGGLGERMAYIYQSLLAKHDFVILVGADIPQMTATELLKAATWLTRAESKRLAFGPSIDGGFWVFGGNCSVPQTLWTDVTYSAPETGSHFFKEIEQLGTVKTLVALRDVDEVSDLLPLRDALLNLPEPLPEQYELLRFLDVLPVSFS